MAATAMGMSKVFILDKYFAELQKFWETEKRLQDATPGEAVNLQNRLRTLSTGLVGLRNTLQENGIPEGQQQQQQQQQRAVVDNTQPAQPNYCNVTTVTSEMQQQQKQQEALHHQQPPPPPPQQQQQATSGFPVDGFNTLRSVRSHVTEVSSVLTGNVSDPASSGANSGGTGPTAQQQQTVVPPPLNQMSPPQPVSTLQHNYSNIQQPSAVMPTGQAPNGTSFRPTPPLGPNSLPSTPAGGGSPFQTLGLPSSSSNSLETKPGPAAAGAFSRSAVRPRTRERNPAEDARKSKMAEIEDLIHLDSPLSEEVIMRTLQARFFNQKYFTNVGPIVLSMNPYRDVGNPLTLNSTKGCAQSDKLQKVVSEVIRLQSETGYPQAIIVSGESGAGKTHTAMVTLRQLFQATGGGTETDTFKHLAAAFTVIRSLGSAKTASNRESSRIGHFIEVQVSDGALYRTKIHCYFLDQSRVVKPLPMEKNYHIFYQMLAGLSLEERQQLGLDGYTPRDLAFLSIGDTRVDEAADAARFAEWKANLAVLGIPFMDVVRVLASILLLGNVEFTPRGGDDAYDVEILGKDELNSVASLLGVPTTLLCQGLTSRTHMARGQPVKSMSDANLCNATRNALAKALYCRTVATIVRRANSLKRPVGPLSGTMSSDSNESVHHEVASHHASTVGTAGSKKSAKSMALLNHAVRHATDGFIGILDMFGFEDSKPSQLEQLCINLCSETMQHFYNTHIFKSSLESCREEGITLDVTVDYVDNVPVIDLISSLRTGLLSMLDVECSVRGFPDTYVQKVKVQHKDNKKLFEPNHCDISRTFGIHHYAGPVVYETSDFLDTNRDVIPDDLVSVFHRDTCNFGFATHLFGNELKALLLNASSGSAASSTSASLSVAPRGVSFRIAPTSHPELLNGDEPVSTLTQDFHTRLDNLLRTLVHAKPHFVRCLRPNAHDSLTEFDRTLVVQQIRSLQILETVNLMSGGFPHRMRFKAFNSRYRMLANSSKALYRSDEKAVDDCETILDCYTRDLRLLPPLENSPKNTQWAHGRKHIFLSEGARQQLERLREMKRHAAATTVQRVWRGFRVRTRGTGAKVSRMMVKAASANPLSLHNPPAAAVTTSAALPVPFNPIHGQQSQSQPNVRLSMRSSQQQRPRPQPITGTPPPDLMQTDKCDFKVIQQTCALFGLDLERPPPIPPSRPYSVFSNRKVNFPQTRIMKHSFTESGAAPQLSLLKGEPVVVLGVSPKRGHLIVERQNHTVHVPYQYLEMRGPPQQPAGPAPAAAMPAQSQSSLLSAPGL